MSIENQEPVEAEVEAPESGDEQPREFEEDITYFGADGKEEEEAAEVVDDAETEVEDVVEDPTDESPVTKQFEFKAYGKTITPKGAVEVEVKDEDGSVEHQIVMTREAFFREIQPRLSDPAAQEAKEREYQAKLEELDPEFNPKVIEAGVFLSKVDGLIELAGSDPELALQALQNFQALAKNWKIEAENAVLKAQSGRRQVQQTSESDQAKVREWATVIESQLGVDSPTNYVAQVIEKAGIELPPGDVQDLKEWAWRNRASFYYEENGQLLGNDQRFEEELGHQISLLKRGPVTKKAEAVKEKNEKKVKGKTVPPTRSAKGKPPGTGKEYVPPKDAAEYRRRMGLE